MQLESHPPQKLAEEATADLHLPSLSQELVEESLRVSYENYRKKSSSHPCLKKTSKVLNRLALNTLAFLHEFWREIIPEVIRGPMAPFTPPASPATEEKERQLFLEYAKKRTPFFLIVYKSDTPEDQIQEAYMSATNIVAEGLSLKQEELEQATTYRDWSVGGVKTDQKYVIHILKFDVFHKMLWFGTITRAHLRHAEPADLLQRFKREVESGLRHYQKAQESFLGSYVEKEDRFVLDSVQEK